ncbi:MAK10-like protein [Tanacetum coccineum]
MVPLQSDIIWLVQNECSFHGLRSEDPNQHLKDFLKLVDSLDLDGENRERTRLRLFQFSLRDQASNWLERLPAGSISTWEDLTTRFLTQFFPPGRTVKLRNDILMFQQHHGESLSEAWTCFKGLLQKDLSLYDNKSWNDPRDFTKPVKAIALPQVVPSTSDRRLIELENQVQRLMEAYLAPTQTIQVNKLSSSCEICSGPHDTQYCMKNPEQAFVDYASSTDSDTEEEDVLSTNACDLNLSGMVKGKEGVKEQGKEENEMETDMEVDEVIKEEESKFETGEEVEEILEEEEDDEDGENFNLFLTMEELTHHEWLLKNPRPPWVKARIRAGSPNNIKISCMVGHLFMRHAYIDLESPIKIMSRRQYNQIMTYGLISRQKPSNPNKISNFIGRTRGLKVFIGSFTYECDFMILEDTTSIIDHYLGEMVFGRPFIDETGLV